MDPVVTEQLGPRRPAPPGANRAPGNGDSASNDRLASNGVPADSDLGRHCPSRNSVAHLNRLDKHAQPLKYTALELDRHTRREDLFRSRFRRSYEDQSKVRRVCRVAGRPRVSPRAMPPMAAQRIIASE